MATFAFQQVDVFTAVPLLGNPLAVVRAADALTDAQMAALARWTNLSETAFLVTPTVAEADYRVRIFTPRGELPFAGHPTLGSCHVWLAGAGGRAGRRWCRSAASASSASGAMGRSSPSRPRRCAAPVPPSRGLSRR